MPRPRGWRCQGQGRRRRLSEEDEVVRVKLTVTVTVTKKARTMRFGAVCLIILFAAGTGRRKERKENIASCQHSWLGDATVWRWRKREHLNRGERPDQGVGSMSFLLVLVLVLILLLSFFLRPYERKRAITRYIIRIALILVSFHNYLVSRKSHTRTILPYHRMHLPPCAS